MHGDSPALADIQSAQSLIGAFLPPTPVIPLPSLSAQVGAHIFGKAEFCQPTGSFKVRGAYHAIMRKLKTHGPTPIYTASTGNHGRAVAWVCRQKNLPCKVFLSSLVPDNKRHAVSALGAECGDGGTSQDEAERRAIAEASERGAFYVPPFNHTDVIAGQGTIGLELIEQHPDLKQIIVPLSGGGLTAGILLAIKTLRPEIQIIGVSMDRGAAMYESLKAGQPIDVEEVPTLADSLGGGIGGTDSITFPIVQSLIDDVLCVSEDEIANAMRFAALQEGYWLEGAAAVGIAALLSNRLKIHDQTALILSGRNVAPQTMIPLLNNREAII
jgi:threonine dehydratase